jgi:fumarylacetoacetase
MGLQIIVSPDSPFTIDNIPFGVIKTAKDSRPRCASAIGDYAIDLSLYAQRGNLDSVKEDIDLAHIFRQVRVTSCPFLRRFLIKSLYSIP